MTVEFITALFYEVDEQLGPSPNTLGPPLAQRGRHLGAVACAQGVGNRAFYRWLTRDYRPLFRGFRAHPLFRLLTTHQDWTRLSWLPDGARRH